MQTTVYRRTAVAIALSLPLGTSATSRAAEADFAPFTNIPTQTSGPYCGIYCIYASLCLYGFNINFDDLVDARYVGAFEGSGLGELERAARDFGLKTAALRDMSIESLSQCESPVLLHVKDKRVGKRPDHWVLFLGVESGRARILDPMKPIELIGFGDLLSRWNGTGLVVSKEPPNIPAICAPHWLQVGLILGVCLVLGVRREAGALCRPRPGGPPRAAFRLSTAAREAVAILMLAIALAAILHASSRIGFMRNPQAVASVETRYHSKFLRSESSEEMDDHVASRDAFIIDARFRRDYLAGHIPGAVSIPADSSLDDRSKALQSVSRSTRIVVYCQSEFCEFDDEIATFLLFNGYKNVQIYKPGWMGWDKHVGESPRRRSTESVSSPSPRGNPKTDRGPR